MTHTECPAPEELARAASLGQEGALGGHLAECARCAEQWEADRHLLELARSLPAVVPDASSVRAVRARVVAVATARRRAARSRGIVVSLGLSMAACVALAVGLGRSERARALAGDEPRYHGTVTAAPGARFVRVSALPDEVVRLVAGAIHVEVAPLGTGERFRVLAGDDEVEVRGTGFDVGIADGHLDSVRVSHGRVEVHARAAAVTLGGGEEWHRPAEPYDPSAPGDVAPPALGSDAPEPESTAPGRDARGGRSSSPAKPSRSPGDFPTAPASAALQDAVVPAAQDAPETAQGPRTEATVAAPSLSAPAAPAGAAEALPSRTAPAREDAAEERRERLEERRERREERRRDLREQRRPR
jgi:hypothetical protein